MTAPKSRIGIIGAGAIGGFYGVMLARAGYDVHFLLRSEYERGRAVRRVSTLMRLRTSRRRVGRSWSGICRITVFPYCSTPVRNP